MFNIEMQYFIQHACHACNVLNKNITINSIFERYKGLNKCMKMYTKVIFKFKTFL